MMLLTDGTVMVEGGGQASSWYKLSPNASGSYVNGTWTTLASMHQTRLYFASNVLPSGNVFVEGGEYSSAGSFTNTGEVYNPSTNNWTTIANFPQTQFGDDPSVVLDGGNILTGYISGPQTYLYNPAANTWSAAGTKLNNEQSDEEGWARLADGSILSYNIFSSINTGTSTAQRYVPSTNTWVSAGTLPVQLSSSAVGEELGPYALLPNGKAFLVGGNNNTAVYDASSNTWTAGPTIPNGMAGDDAPGAMLPTGQMMFAADVPLFNSPSALFLYDPGSNTISPVTSTPSALTGVLNGQPSYVDRMLMLPNGQLLFNDSTSTLWVYTPSGSTSSAVPVVQNVTNNGNGVYTLTGTQLNGQSEGATYGDDAEMSSNYPIVYLTNSSGNVYYARTSGWSTNGVQTGSAAETVNFTLPGGLPQGSYSLFVSGAGLSSAAFPFTVGASAHLQITGPSSSTAGSPFSITVTALDSTNNVLTGYTGTVHFTSSDGQATLPADYTFNAGDAGVHTFTNGVTLKTAGSQSVAATDTSSSSITGSLSVSVSPAAASRLVFGQQPTNTKVSSPITPAVTVRVTDAYGNLETGDNTHVVGMAIGSNPGGGTLSGTTSVTVSGGVATFPNLSINKAANGYTLVASATGLTGATSIAFNISKGHGHGPGVEPPRVADSLPGSDVVPAPTGRSAGAFPVRSQQEASASPNAAGHGAEADRPEVAGAPCGVASPTSALLAAATDSLFGTPGSDLFSVVAVLGETLSRP
jgi:hypothetical protein